jgi:1-acyl-sn-glycerol-3-phosphate acyltransferase
MRKKLLRLLVRFLFRLLTRLEIIGLDNIPQQGGCLLAVNHLSRLDPPLVFALARREDVTAMVADNYQKRPFFRWIVNAVDGIWVDREDADFHALRRARDYLKAGHALGIAPEGTRSQTGGLLPGKTGTAYLADKAGVPVVPIGITGTDQAIRRLLRLQRPPIRILFGEPIHLPPLERRSRAEDLERNTEIIMCHIAALLPPEHRGVYADCPRLKEMEGEARQVV